MDWLLYHTIALAIGLTLDLIVGDPPRWPHPIRLIGRLISALDRAFMDQRTRVGRDPKREFRDGVLTCVIVVFVSAGAALAITYGAYRLNAWVGIAVESVLTFWALAARSLRDESVKVCRALETGTLEESRSAVAMIVGRDVTSLDASGVARAAVETVAENTSDGVVAPFLYLLLGGPALGFAYKAVNTLDSMIGYQNERYGDFGKASARLDDIISFVPARISAILMIVAAFLLGREYSGRGALRVFIRDRYNHKSPNAAQTESVCAGALGLQLAGDARYSGKLVKKPYIGDARREIEARDIRRACRLMFATEALFATLALAAILAVRALWF
ncbi:MAG: adenosylcobinamide-phosphate synthase CbiB [Thermoguttaceae bacterium]|jgi:adenosylcobinamide-phosphate synthase